MQFIYKCIREKLNYEYDNSYTNQNLKKISSYLNLFNGKMSNTEKVFYDFLFNYFKIYFFVKYVMQLFCTKIFNRFYKKIIVIKTIIHKIELNYIRFFYMRFQ